MTDGLSSDDAFDVMKVVLERFAGQNLTWALTGSLAHHLQGVPVPVHDVDLQTDEDSAWRVDSALASHVRSRAAWRESERIRSIFGQYDINGAQVELMGAMAKRASASAPWGDPTSPADHAQTLEWRGLLVPVMTLRYEAQAYAEMGRTERSDLLRRHAGVAEQEQN